MSEPIACPVCAAASREAFSATVLGTHQATYRSCPQCEFVFVHQPHWLDQAYSDAIACADTGLVARNLKLADRLASVLVACFDPHGAYLDAAGGTGLLARLMRDRGFDYFWSDRYSANIHARGFEADPAGKDFEAVTAFEALEHMTDPVAFVADALSRTRSRTLLFSTELHGGAPPPTDWWYYAFATGQHISFFSRRTLERIGERLDCTLHSARGLHLLTGKAVSARRYGLAAGALRPWYRWQAARSLPSRVDSDHQQILRRGGLA